jgi:hypothetical protein
VAKALRYHLFGIGKMPPPLREAAAENEALLAAEGISLKQTVDGLKIPRASVRHGVKLLVGSVVILPNRLMLGVGKHVIVDAAIDPTTQAPATLTLAEDGIRISFDVANVINGGSGAMEVQYRLRLSSAVLGQLRTMSLCATISNPGPGLLNGWKGTWAR